MDWIVIALLVQYALFEWNLLVYKPFGDIRLEAWPSASILVPCRNEAPRIEKNVRTMLAQDYPDFEVIVFDDDSDDGSRQILERLAVGNPRLKVLRGGTLQSGWTGKNHACHRLAQAARGEWILFVDADTSHAPGMLRGAIGTAITEKASFLSTFPRQIFRVGDELVVPLMFYILLTFLPMFFLERRTWRWTGDFAAACGQFLLFKKDAYWQVGGHEAVRSRISEATALASAIKKSGGKILLRDGSSVTSCSMYENLGQAVGGFARSVFATMNGSALTGAFFFIYQTAVFVVPPVILAGCLATGSGPLKAALAATAIPVWIRFRIHHRIGMRLRSIWTHAFGMAIYNYVILGSIFKFKIAKNAVWKNRAYVPGEAS